MTLLAFFALFFQSVFIENFILVNFLGMCTYLACSQTVKTAHNLGMAVTVVMVLAGMLNWLIHYSITGPTALHWLDPSLNLTFLEYFLFIAVIAAFVQVLEIVVENLLPSLYQTLGIYLPLITVNCAILGASLFMINRDYPFFAAIAYLLGAGVGWWIAILLIAAIRQKLLYARPPQGLEGMGITFIATGFIAIAFLGLSGIKLDTIAHYSDIPTPTKILQNRIE